MSTDATHSEEVSTGDHLTDEERETFERIAEEFADDDVGEICEAVLQSDDSEEASS